MKTIIQLFFIIIFLLPSLKLKSEPADSSSISNMTSEKWSEDLHYMVSEMQKVHQNIFHSMTKEELEKAVNELDKKIPSLSTNQIFVEFLKIIKMIGDGHTYLLPDIMHSFPIRLYDFEDGVFVTNTSDNYKELIGFKLIKIGNKNLNEIYEQYKAIIARDNDIWLRSLTPHQIVIAEYLNGLGIINDINNAEFIFEDKLGNRKSYFLNSRVMDQQEYFNESHFQKTEDLAPLYLQEPDKFYWLKYLDDSKILYIKYNVVQFDRNENMNAFIKRIEHIVNSKEVDKVVIDIRNNGGGNNFTSLPLVEFLSNNENINNYGKLYAIIGRQTFSAASFFTTALENRTNTIFVGEPTGADPNHYGDNKRVELPNSKLSPRFSTIYWENSFPSDNRKWTAPDIQVVLTSSDFFSHRDPILEAVINHKPEPLNYKKLSSEQVKKFTGRFEFSPDQILEVKEKNGNLIIEVTNFYKTILYPDKINHFQTSRKNVEVYFDESKNYNEITISANGNEINYNRLPFDKFLSSELLEMGKYEEAISALRDLKKNHPERRSVSETNINVLGYDLINKNKLDAAIEVFKLNVEFYPNAFNTYDSLGEVYMNAGNTELAIINYEKSIELNPNNENGKKILEKLKSGNK